MNEYVRPSIPERAYRDGSGAVIAYGDRWGIESPPDDSYSRTSNLDRFEPLHRIVDALIDHLVSTYEVTVTPVEIDDTDWNCSVVKAVRLAPATADAASLLFRVTDYPSVEVDAGLVRRAGYPDCSCDACDDTWERLAEELEDLVLAVPAGLFNERIVLTSPPGAMAEQGRVGFDFFAENGDVVQTSESSVEVTDELCATAARLAARPGQRWQPWSRR